MHETMKRLYTAAKELKAISGQTEVAKLLGESPQTVNNWEKRGVSTQGRLNAQAIIGCDALWIKTGKGVMSIYTRRDGVSRFDVLDARASCGPGAVNADYPVVVQSIEMPKEIARQLIGRTDDAVRIIRATHDSMVPTINPDDLLFIDTTVTEFQAEGIYLVLHGRELVCKRLSIIGKRLKVTSDNKFYESWLWDERLEDDRIVGKVLRALPMDFKNFGG